jgi:hypothetical protein
VFSRENTLIKRWFLLRETPLPLKPPYDVSTPLIFFNFKEKNLFLGGGKKAGASVGAKRGTFFLVFLGSQRSECP